MANYWKPKNWEEVCKRNAGRRKLHMQNRERRAKRVQLLNTLGVTGALRESSYGKLPVIAKEFEVSVATASRDLALCRRIHFQFLQMFGRRLTPGEDLVIWSWDWSHYGFRTSESTSDGHRKPVGKFIFSTRSDLCASSDFDGANGLSWQEEVTQTYNVDLFLRLRSLLRE